MIAAVLLAASLQAQPAVPPSSHAPPRDAPAPATTGQGVIRGRVVAADTGAPIRECSVALMPQGGQPTYGRTDGQGRFVFREVPSGTYRLRTTLAGPPGRYLGGVYGGRDPRDSGKPIEIAGAQVVEGLEIRLSRGAVMAGRVLDEYGEPASFIRVYPLMRVEGGEPRRTGGYPMNLTDDLGQFRLFGLMPGDYLLMAEPQRFWSGPQEKESSVQYLPTYLPSTLTSAEAGVVRVRAGQEIGDLEIRLLRGRTFKVTGTITNAAGEPFTRRMGYVSFNEISYGGSMGHSVDLRDDGTFEIRGVKPGNYSIEAAPERRSQDDDPGPDAQFAHMPVTVTNSDVEGLAVITQRGASVAGDVLYDEPAPADAPPLMIVAQPSGRQQGGRFWSEAKAAADGSFVLRGLFQPRTIRIMNPPRGYFLSSIVYDGADITDKSIDFKPGRTGRLAITLTRRMSELSGRVVDAQGRAVPEALVLAFGEDRGLWFQFATTTRFGRSDEKGDYKLGGLRAGSYLVIAMSNDRRPLHLDEGSEIWEALAKKATAVTVGDNEQKTFELRVTPEIER